MRMAVQYSIVVYCLYVVIATWHATFQTIHYLILHFCSYFCTHPVLASHFHLYFNTIIIL